MNELTKDQWERSMSTGFGDPDHPVNTDVKHHVGKLKVQVENAEMAMSDVTKLIKYSEALQKMFNPSEDLEDWVEAKLNHACDYVATVRDYLKFYRDEKEAGTPEDQINEKWSRKYKQGIDCSHPKGFSQRAHCAGRRARQAGKRTKSSSVSEVELYNDVLKDLVEALIEDIGNSYMAMGALKQINNDAKELQTMLKPDTQLEDWVKAKLNLAGEYLDDVYHHLDHFGPEGRKLDEGDDFYDPERRRTQAMGFRSTVDNPKPKDIETEDRASYWISPDGEIINANKNHKKWVLDNRLKRNIQMVDDSPMKSAFMKGYIKISRLPNGIVVDSVPDQYDMGGGFYKNGHEGIYPKISEKALDAIQKFIDDRPDIALVIDSDRKRLKDFRIALPENLTEEQMDEIWKNWKQALATTALATSMLGAPKADAAPEKTVSPQTVSATSQQYGYTVEDIIAATLVDEAGGEKNAGEGMHAVLNVIMNRAKGNIRNAAMECLKPKQFSGWNKVNKKDVNDIKKFIDSKKNHSKYKEAIKLVQQAKSGTLKDITKGSNHFLNVHLTKQQRSGGKLPSWYDPKKVVTVFGKHRFLKLEEVYELA
jgi:hypothetical protein